MAIFTLRVRMVSGLCSRERLLSWTFRVAVALPWSCGGLQLFLAGGWWLGFSRFRGSSGRLGLLPWAYRLKPSKLEGRRNSVSYITESARAHSYFLS